MSPEVPAPPWRAVKDGVELAVRVTPRAARTSLAGTKEDAQGRLALQIRLAAPPVEGAANDALVAFLAAELRVARRDVVLHAGQGSRSKQVRIAGNPEELAGRLARWIAAATGRSESAGSAQ